jgi:hypothetical protein
VNRVQSKAYVDRWARLSLLAPILGVVLFIVYALAHRDVWSGTLTVSEDEPGTTPELTLPDSWIGAVRIEAHAILPTNRWAAYQVTVLAPDGTALLEVVKEAWAESGTWAEDGERGTWAEDDLDMLWDLRARQAEPVRFEVSLLDQGTSINDTSWSDSDDAAGGGASGGLVQVRLAVRAGVVDGRFIALAFLLSLAFSVLAYYVAGHGGVPVIVEINHDSEVKGRAEMGGAGKLVSVAVSGLVDETAPHNMNVRVILRDEAGVDRYKDTEVVPVSFRRDEGEIEDGRFALHCYFELPRAGSWGVFADVAPDGPVENVKLVVRDGATTRGTIEVEKLPDAEAAS